MKILYLGPESPLINFLKQEGNLVVQTERPLELYQVRNGNFEFLISYGYRHILRPNILELFEERRRLNLHISYLPWNRGADPNFWSFVQRTPKGVTIHSIDHGVDTGPILLQEETSFAEGETLRTSYAKLQTQIQQLFMDNWLKLKEGLIEPKLQTGEGSYHRVSDKISYLESFKVFDLDLDVNQFS